MVEGEDATYVEYLGQIELSGAHSSPGNANSIVQDFNSVKQVPLPTTITITQQAPPINIIMQETIIYIIVNGKINKDELLDNHFIAIFIEKLFISWDSMLTNSVIMDLQIGMKIVPFSKFE